MNDRYLLLGQLFSCTARLDIMVLMILVIDVLKAWKWYTMMLHEF